ncbi:MAG: anthranilate phosphoribosyltransferase [Candidatus Omnitrophica bacterium]|nr:anthranilate phosphoribosyltransferase [Candidatus Omnitrophota bacterium]
MVLMIDNYDSFTYNLVQLIGELGYKVKTYRNDEISISDIKKMKPTHIVVSPGPGTPKDAGISCKVIKEFAGKIPILGVCLGHQCIIETFGGRIISADQIVHGKTSKVMHDNRGVFRNIPQGIEVVRYHSLVGDPTRIPDCLEVTARTQNTIMGVRHKNYQVVGVQFHPESISTQYGKKIVKNFFNYKAEEPQKNSIIKRVSMGKDLTAKESYNIMDEITEGDLTEAQVGVFLGALSVKGISATEMSSFVKLFKDKAGVKVKIKGLLDTCGTGGDGKQTFNISTAAAILCGFSGAKVAKHGNRSVTSKSGSFDLLTSLGVETQGDINQNIKSIKKKNFAFFFAPKYHPAMKHVAKIRQEIKQRTVFNMIGPLANPMEIDYQLAGVFSADIMDLYINTMSKIGRKRAMVVHSYDGMDEISICAKTAVMELKKDGSIVSYVIDPKALGIQGYEISDLEGKSAYDNARTFLKIIGKRNGLTKKEKAVKEAICLNAGAALYIAEKAKDIKEGYVLAKRNFEKKSFIGYINSLKG